MISVAEVDDERDQIEMYEYKSIDEVYEHKDAFTLRPDRKYVWVQKVCLWVMKHLCANYLEPTVRIERIPVKRGQLIETLFRMKCALRVLNRDPAVVLMGQEDYFKAINEDSCGVLTPPFGFNATYMKAVKPATRPTLGALDRFERDFTPCGLKVYVIPWMKGVLVV